jgi:sarcosine oxidase subunit beta
MSETPSVVIVGAGAAGLSTALCLAERGCTDVKVIDREHVAAGSSSLSAGIFVRGYSERLDVALRVEAYERLCRLERDEGLTLRRNGFLRLGRDDADIAGFTASLEVLHELGVEDAVVLDRAGLEAHVPDMRCDDLAGGLLTPTDGYLDGQQLCMAYAERAERLGVRVLGRHPLTGYKQLADGRHRLVTPRATFDCDVVVNAAGAWAPAVGDLLEAPVEIMPERHEACIMRLAAPLGYSLPSIMDYVPGGEGQGIYLRPEGEHQLVCGLHTNDVLGEPADADDFYGGAEATFVDALIPALVDRMPGFESVGLETGWAGLYPHSSDGRFVIGAIPGRPGVVAICGLGGVGVYMSPTTGRMACDWVLDGCARTNAERLAFAPARFG